MDGEAKTYVIEGGSGKPVHVFFCPTCGTVMWSEPERMEGIACVKAGIFDDGGRSSSSRRWRSSLRGEEISCRLLRERLQFEGPHSWDAESDRLRSLNTFCLATMH